MGLWNSLLMGRDQDQQQLPALNTGRVSKGIVSGVSWQVTRNMGCLIQRFSVSHMPDFSWKGQFYLYCFNLGTPSLPSVDSVDIADVPPWRKDYQKNYHDAGALQLTADRGKIYVHNNLWTSKMNIWCTSIKEFHRCWFTDVGFHLKSGFKKLLCSQMLVFTLILDSQKYCVHQIFLYISFMRWAG